MATHSEQPFLFLSLNSSSVYLTSVLFVHSPFFGTEDQSKGNQSFLIICDITVLCPVVQVFHIKSIRCVQNSKCLRKYEENL